MTLIWHGDELLARLGHSTHESVTAGAQALQDATERVIPIRSSELRESGRVTADGDRAALSYNTPYAVIEHQSGYPRHTPPRVKHYVTRPMLENGEEVLAAMAEALGRELGL